MALTATATTTVRNDIIQNLKIGDCVVFEQSFNRTNLRYEVRPKKKSVIADIAEWVRRHHDRKCGIIYCLSKKDCEKVAEELRTMGLNACAYHAGLTPTQREDVHMGWLQDEVHIICATIAFGMGINKPDVRFVIHHSLPKSLEGYYQEAGRAGRDGLVSHCILFYSYKDKGRLQMMIMQDKVAPLAKLEGRFNSVVAYCENDVNCRHALVVRTLGVFDDTHCGLMCDNCSHHIGTIVECNVTGHVRNLVSLLDELSQQARVIPTVKQLRDLYRGKDVSGMLHGSHLDMFGKGKELSRADVERVIHIAIRDGVINEFIGKTQGRFYMFVHPAKQPKVNISDDLSYQRVIRTRETRSKVVSAPKKTSVGARVGTRK